MIHTHSAYGLSLHLPFPCPVLPEVETDARPDITLVEGAVPFNLPSPIAQDRNWEAEPGRFLWRAGRRAGRFLVEKGRHITLQRGRLAEDEMISWHFLDNVLAAALRQNGLLVLHASSVVTPAGAVAVSGESGAGKSTTLASLLGHGCAMLADDITALRANAGQIEVIPGVSRFCLCDDAADSLGQDSKKLPRHRTQSRKVVVSGESAMALSPSSLRAIFLLRTYSGRDLRVRQLDGAEKFAALQECIYGPLLPDEHPALFPIFTLLSNQVDVKLIERPVQHWTAKAIAEVVLHG
jgi:hypothetical protein